MVLLSNHSSSKVYYTRNDLYCFNMLVRPVWIFDIDNKTMYWANTAALQHVWNANTLDELLQRDFQSDMSDAASSFLNDVKQRIVENPCTTNITEQWTFYPRGGEHATTIDITCSGIRIGNDNDSSSTRTSTSTSNNNIQKNNNTPRIAMLVEADMILSDDRDTMKNDRMVRSIELLKHIPIAVSQFTLDGRTLIYQNPKAVQYFGHPNANPNQNQNNNPIITTSSTKENINKDLNYSRKDLNVGTSTSTATTTTTSDHSMDNIVDDDDDVAAKKVEKHMTGTTTTAQQQQQQQQQQPFDNNNNEPLTNKQEEEEDEVTSSTPSSTAPTVTSTTTSVNNNSSGGGSSSNNNNNNNNNTLLDRFVDGELGKNAMKMIAEKDEEFNAEVQLYTTTTTSSSTSTTPSDTERSQRTESQQQSQLLQPYRWFHISLRKTRDPVTSDFVILYIARDISDIVKARNDTLRAKMKSEFLNVMAHEIRTPLHQIIGHADLLEDTSSSTTTNAASATTSKSILNNDTSSHSKQCAITHNGNHNHYTTKNPLNDEQLASVRQIQSSCSMLISIINDLLDCSKLENGQVQKEEITFNLYTFMNNCIESMQSQIQPNKKGLLQLSYRIDIPSSEDDDDTITRLISDPNRLQQILHNLISNAIKFSSVGSVTVIVKPFPTTTTDPGSCSDHLSLLGSTSASSCIETMDGKGGSSHSTASSSIINDNKNKNNERQQHLLFEVIDTGIGIAECEQNIVFERYRQANPSVARNFGGTGLGLPICKGLVELLGGTIGLKSKLGVGTTVYFDIPFKVAPKLSIIPPLNPTTTATPTPTKAITADVSKLNILVVEDNIVNQKVVKAMLQRLGHVTSIADNGESALTMIRQKQYHLVLMDIQMPIMDGIECTKYIRNTLRYDKDSLPIIGLTAGYQPTERDYYVNDVGMNACVGKPLPMNKLKEAIDTFYHRNIDQGRSFNNNNKNHLTHKSISCPVEIGGTTTSLVAVQKRALTESLSPSFHQPKSAIPNLEPANKRRRH